MLARILSTPILVCCATASIFAQTPETTNPATPSKVIINSQPVTTGAPSTTPVNKATPPAPPAEPTLRFDVSPQSTSAPTAPTPPATTGAPAAPVNATSPATLPTTPTPPETTDGSAEPPAARAVLVTKQEVTAQLQIFLDQQLFSPGRIDGSPGKFLTRALRRWQRAHALPDTGILDANVPLDSVYPVYITHAVTDEEKKFIGALPGKTSEQAKKKKLPYASYAEYLSERYHCSSEFLQKLNPKVKLEIAKAGDEIRVPNVAPFKIEEMPPTGNFPEMPELKNRRIEISLANTMLELYEGDKLIACIPIAPGSPRNPTPKGKWKILGVASMPTFRWDKGVLNNGVRTKNFFNLPPGPNNPVGVGWIGLNKPGIGIHGTNNPDSIGTFASHGCMRTANWDISRIAKMVTVGVPVVIR